MPGTYAMQAYDAAQMIDSAIKAAGGKLDDKDAIRKRSEAADFTSLRGNFKIGPNHYPIQDFYLVKVAKRDDGKYQTQIEQEDLHRLRRQLCQGLQDELSRLQRGGSAAPLLANL